MLVLPVKQTIDGKKSDYSHTLQDLQFIYKNAKLVNSLKVITLLMKL